MNTQNTRYRLFVKSEQGEEYMCDISIRDLAQAMTEEQIAELLGDKLNTYTNPFKSGEQLGIELRKQHRTLQRLIVIYLVTALGKMNDGYSDPRNEKAMQLCAAIKELANKMGFGGFV